MAEIGIDYRPFDQDIWTNELEDFVPDQIFDMHTHLWNKKHIGDNADKRTRARMEVDFQGLENLSARLFPGRQIHFLVLGTPIRDMDIDGHNMWIAAQVARDRTSHASMVVTPHMSPKDVENQVKKHNFLGLKPYRVFAQDMTNAGINDYLPERLIEVADHLGLAITLHLSKKTGVADSDNLNDLKKYTSRYPNVQWILAHCARAFNSFMLEKSIHILKNLPNIWYDTSAVNDLYAHWLLLKYEDRKRVMFGSDNAGTGCMRGKYITYGRAWTCYEGKKCLEHCDPTPTLVIYEQLKVQRQAADMLGLSSSEVKDLFSKNSKRLIEKIKHFSR